ncbi:MAG: hypothetical protein Q3968_03600 [Clostridiaceae bacterium]|nr:hypothetical protein [Clostridiaceae bacterium]
MLSEEKEIELEILEICKNSGDVNVGDRFDGVMYNSEFGDRPCVCIGKTNNTRLFVTEDKRCYFTVSGGWGVKDGKLASVDIYGRLRFDKPSGADEIRNYMNSLKPAKGWSSAMLRYGRMTLARSYLNVMQKFEEDENGDKDIQPHECG